MLAFQVLERWEKEGIALDQALEQVCANTVPRERALAHELSFGVVRWLLRLDDLLGQLLRQPLARLHPQLLLLLRLGLYQLRFSRAPARAIIHETVEQARRLGLPWATGLVNGILRRYDREKEQIEATPIGTSIEALARRYAHPPWLVRLLEPSAQQTVEAGGLEAWLLANNQTPPLTLRANPLRISRGELLALLNAAGIRAEALPFSPGALRVVDGGNPAQLPGFAEGLFAIQDEASQLVADILGVKPGEQVLDACAAPGGKTAALAAAAGATGWVLATDSVKERLKQVTETVDRLEPGKVTLAVCDWTQAGAGEALVGSAELKQSLPCVPSERIQFDRALVDAPCSGLGVLRRIPEIKWRRGLEDLPRTLQRQKGILQAVAQQVRPGGTLVYSVCSPLPAEGPGIVDAFLAQNKGWRRVELRSVLAPQAHSLVTPEGDLRTFPHRDGCDAFYAARLERSLEPILEPSPGPSLLSPVEKGPVERSAGASTDPARPGTHTR